MTAKRILTHFEVLFQHANVQLIRMSLQSCPHALLFGQDAPIKLETGTSTISHQAKRFPAKWPRPPAVLWNSKIW